MVKTNSATVLKYFVFTYWISICFIGLLDLPYVGQKIQLPEIVFACFLPWIVWTLYPQRLQTIFPFHGVDKGILIYLLFIGLSVCLNPNSTASSYLQGLGMIYLGLVAWCTKMWVVQCNSIHWIEDISKLSRGIAVGLGMVSIVSWLLWYFTGYQHEALLQPREAYLYFSKTVRSQGWVGDPNMLSDIFLIFTILGFGTQGIRGRWNYKDYILLSIALIGNLFTLSKSVLLLGLILPWLGRFGKPVWYVFVTILLFVTHFFVSSPDRFDVRQLNKGGSFVGDTAWFQWGNQGFYPTSYSINKKVSLQGFLSEPLTGIGLTHQPKLACELQQKGQYPTFFSCLDSHCSYLGLLAETGIVGMAGLLLFIFCMYKSLIDIELTKNSYSFFVPILSILLSILWYESWILETYSFRHYWFVIGIFSGFLSVHRRF
jgi:hypothetical protein